MIVLYSAAIFSIVVGFGAIFTLIEKFPVNLLYYHYHFRKPIVWGIFIVSLMWQVLGAKTGFTLGAIPPIAIMALAIVLAYKAHQSNWFRAVDFPEMTRNADSLPIPEESEMALISFEGVTKAYPLDYVIHHHIVNDRFGDKTIALTYCAMCRSVIPFDVSAIGPLFVASFKNANMIVSDKKTGTFFQQAKFNSIIGKLHPSSLEMIPFQVQPWRNVRSMDPMPLIANVEKTDLREFRLPMPGVWKKVMSSELTPGLSKKDTRYPSKTRIIGLYDLGVFYLRSELRSKKIVVNNELDLCLIALGTAVIGFKNSIGTNNLDLGLKNERSIEDQQSGTSWDLTGKHLNGPITEDLLQLAISDEYWFSWTKFHAESKLLTLEN